MARKYFTLAVVVLVMALCVAGFGQTFTVTVQVTGTGGGANWFSGLPGQGIGGFEPLNDLSSSSLGNSISTPDAPVPHRDVQSGGGDSWDFSLFKNAVSPTFVNRPGPPSANIAWFVADQIGGSFLRLMNLVCPPPLYCGPMAGFGFDDGENMPRLKFGGSLKYGPEFYKGMDFHASLNHWEMQESGTGWGKGLNADIPGRHLLGQLDTMRITQPQYADAVERVGVRFWQQGLSAQNAIRREPSLMEVFNKLAEKDADFRILQGENAAARKLYFNHYQDKGLKAFGNK